MSSGIDEDSAKINPTISRMLEADIVEVQLIEYEGNLSPWSIEGYRSELNNPAAVCLVAKIENNIIGFMLSRLIMSNKCCEVYNIGVKTEYRRTRIGSNLINYLVNICISSNLEEIVLEVRKSNTPAIKFYLKQRFEISYIRKNFYNSPIEDAYVMIKKIN